jgi:hypothetical protein
MSGQRIPEPGRGLNPKLRVSSTCHTEGSPLERAFTREGNYYLSEPLVEQMKKYSTANIRVSKGILKSIFI